MGMGMGTRGLRGYPNPCGLHVHQRGKEGTTLPVASIRVFRCSREGDPPRHVNLRRLVCVCAMGCQMGEGTSWGGEGGG